MGDCHARFWERLELQCSGLLDVCCENIAAAMFVTVKEMREGPS